MEMNDFSQNLDLINDRHNQTQAVHEWSLDGGHLQRWRSKNLSLIMEEQHVYPLTVVSSAVDPGFNSWVKPKTINFVVAASLLSKQY